MSTASSIHRQPPRTPAPPPPGRADVPPEAPPVAEKNKRQIDGFTYIYGHSRCLEIIFATWRHVVGGIRVFGSAHASKIFRIRLFRTRNTNIRACFFSFTTVYEARARTVDRSYIILFLWNVALTGGTPPACYSTWHRLRRDSKLMDGHYSLHDFVIIMVRTRGSPLSALLRAGIHEANYRAKT